MNQYKTGLVLGSFAALVHVVWVILVAGGWAQPWINFVYNMHFIGHQFVVMPFDLPRALGVVVLAFVMGNIVGNVFGCIWNQIYR